MHACMIGFYFCCALNDFARGMGRMIPRALLQKSESYRSITFVWVMHKVYVYAVAVYMIDEYELSVWVQIAGDGYGEMFIT